MTTYEVAGTVGTLYATVEADNEDDAISAAIAEWDAESLDVFVAATFEARRVDD